MNALPSYEPDAMPRDYALPEEISARAAETQDPGDVRKTVLARILEAVVTDETYESAFRHPDALWRGRTLSYAYLAPNVIEMVVMQALGEMAPLPAAGFPPEELTLAWAAETAKTDPKLKKFVEDVSGLDRMTTELVASLHPNASVNTLEKLARSALNPAARKAAERRISDESFRAEWEHLESFDDDNAQALSDLLLVGLKHCGPACAAARLLAEKTERLAEVIEMRSGDFGPAVVGKILARYPPAASKVFRMVLTRFPHDAGMMTAMAGSPLVPAALAAHIAKNPGVRTEVVEQLLNHPDAEVREHARKSLEDRKKDGNVSTERVRKVAPRVRAALQGTAAGEALGIKAGAARVHAGIAAAGRIDPLEIAEKVATETIAKRETARTSAQAAEASREEGTPASVTDRDAQNFSQAAAGDYAPETSRVTADAPERDIDELTKLHAKADTPMEQTALAREVLAIKERGLTSRSRKAAETPAAPAPVVVTERPGVGDSSGAERAAAAEWPGLRVAAATIAAGGVTPETLGDDALAAQAPDMSARIVKSEKIVRQESAVDKARPGA